MTHSLTRGRGRLLLLALGSAVGLFGATPIDAQHAEHMGGATPAMGSDAARYVASPVAEGQRYFMATDGFGALIGPDLRSGDPGALAALAREAELAGHEIVGVQTVDGSTPMRHW
ncbi:MAG TPA: hypothetical protein VLA09_07575, partial [Longimicrobiales bacterium]|nr:hypothetical protein [Longimicrobiales bacterium]